MNGDGNSGGDRRYTSQKSPTQIAAMGKSAKKKRLRERERLLRLQQAGVTCTPCSSILASDGTALTALAATDVYTTPTAVSNGDSQRKHHPSSAPQKITHLGPVKDSTFGSAASRTRILPKVAFVFPKRSDQSTAEPYEFGKNPAKANASHQENGTDLPRSNHPTVKANQSIDDILFSKAKATQQQLEMNSDTPNETNGERKDEVAPKVAFTKRSLSEGVQLKDTPRSSSLTRERSSTGATAPNVASLSPDETEHTHRSPYFSGISVEEAVRDKVGLRPRSNSTDGELKLPQRGLCDERKVLETFQWKNNHWKVPPKGFNNLGNTCFLNSTLQCLAYCPPFCQSLMAMPQSDAAMMASSIAGSKNKFKLKKEKGTSEGKRMTLMLGAFFRQVHGTGNVVNGNNNGSSFGGSRAVSPSSIVRAVPSLGSSRNGYKFRPGRQEDAHEFLVHLLDAMNDGELREAGINSQKSGWRDRLPVPRLDETTFIHRIFGGYLRSQVQCTSCGYISNTYDPFLDLSLEISRKSCHSIASAFQEFTRKETLDSENRWKCSGCKKRVCATKLLSVFRPPLSLCMQLKRFSYGGSFGGLGGRMGGKKISKPIEFPANMQLPLSDGRSCGYVLTGIVIHVGGSASSGHYTAYVKRPGLGGQCKWYHMDDSFVQAVSEQDVLRQRDAYVLMYCRAEVKLEFPTPPLRGSMTADEAQELIRSRARARADSLTDTIGAIRSADIPETETIQTASSATTHCSPTVASKSRTGESSKDEARSELRAPALESVKTAVAEVKEILIGPLLQNGKKFGTELPTPAPSSSSESSESDGSDSSDEGTSQIESGKVDEQTTTPKSAPSSSSEDDSSESSDSSTSSGSELEESEDGRTSVDKPTPSSKASPSSKTSPSSMASPSSGSSNPAKPKVTRITVDRGESGKVVVMMGPRYKTKKTWQPKTTEGQKDEGYDLLGNLRVSKWDDDDDDSTGKDNGNRSKKSLQARAKMAKQMDQFEKERKRKMFLDRHDAQLDQGKTKKVKHNKVKLVHAPTTPSNNAFQLIQASMQIRNKGQAKGHIQQTKAISGKRRR